MSELRHLSDATIGDRLSELKYTMLPGEIVQDENVQWVLAFDDLSDAKDFRGWDSFPPRNAIFQAATQIVSIVLQDQIPFYFGTLFHIGRQLKVSETLLKESDRLLLEKNLGASVRNLIELSADTNRRLRPQQARAAVRQLASSAASQHQRSLSQARSWWAVWKSEVSELRNLVSTFMTTEMPSKAAEVSSQWWESWSALLLWPHRPNRLRMVLSQGGVHLRDDRDAEQRQITALLSTPAIFGIAGLLALCSDIPSRIGYDYLQRFESYLYEHMRLLHEIRIRPEVREAELRLQQRFEGQNPLEAFGPGLKPASEELVSLLRQNELPYGQQSQWRREWIRSLEPEPSRFWYTFDVSADKALVPDRISQAVLSVDSTIKHHVIDTQRSPIETWSEYCQRIFEQNWIRFVTRSIFEKKDGPSVQQGGWGPKLLQTFLTAIVIELNKLGYSLTVPTENRLNTLVLRVSRGDTVREEDW